ncbi:MAG: sulfate adenylyltransferase subunit CysN [Planctomycetota bacterium]
MSHQSELIATDIDAYLKQHEEKELLRFITCGSVDDGKSTLIGRLLYDSKMIYEDTLAKIEKDSAIHGTTGGGFDPALLTDGLKAEREQGITIDVAYRYFSTAKRKFIIADTPGHVQYTRNMATGASTADLAIILIDARYGVLEQTKRHSFIASLLGIKHILVAINKMDLVDFDQKVFDQIQSDYKSFASRLEPTDLHFVPISALDGDNLVERSDRCPWYNGPTLMNLLEEGIYIGSDRNLQDFRFPVQFVVRPNLDFRGFAGTIASGIVRQGDEIMALPSRKTSKVKEIVTMDGNLEEAHAPLSVTLTLEDEIDISRGDMIVRPGNVPKLEQKFDAMIVWMSEQAMVPGKQYLFKQTTKMVPGSISTLRYQVDVNTLHRLPSPTLELNQIGRCYVSLNEPIIFDRYQRNRATGAFIVVDRITNTTVGAGMIIDRRTGEDRGDHWEDDPSESLQAESSNVSVDERRARFGQTAVTVLLTGLPGSGKTTTAYALERRLFDNGRAAAVIDGQNMRLGLSRDLSFSDDARSENLRRAAEAARLINQSGLICVLAMIAPNEEARARSADVIGKEKFLMVHLDAPPEVCAERNQSDESDCVESDPNFETPSDPDLVLNTAENSTKQCVDKIIGLLQERSLID